MGFSGRAARAATHGIPGCLAKDPAGRRSQGWGHAAVGNGAKGATGAGEVRGRGSSLNEI